IPLNSASKRSWVTFSCLLFIAAKCQLVQTQGLRRAMTLDDSLPLLYETLRERYRRRTIP
ncbi:hypothetical protein, partial [Nostoc sp.]|uniref:hypothetical protein n=1 Tax=Nostoc sp. TaxID=1180 RepID=UPI002FFCFEBA